MDPNEREELEAEFFARSELQNAFVQSQMEVERRDPEIDKALAEGKHVVVCHYPAFCPRTDAAMGEKQGFVSAHGCRDTAEDAKAALEANAADDDVMDIHWTIESPPGTILVDVDEVTGDVTEYDAATGEVQPPPDDVPF